jgi:Rps23 Pro-64 3,4-dihydroxylase Tpa1-like proline 4-hydroxylase
MSQNNNMFGEWISDINSISCDFATVGHVVIHNFFADDAAKAISSEFGTPNVDDGWFEYKNPLERKFAKNTNLGKQTTDTFDVLQSPEFVDLVSRISGIPDIEADPHLHGAGIHAYPPGGHLSVHLDYSLHPVTGKERRLNLLVFLNEDWKEEYGGDLLLMNDINAKDEDIVKVSPTWNTAILFKTTDDSFHGLPIPTKTDEFRKSLAIYYVSDPRSDATMRQKAQFFPFRHVPHEKLQKLYDIRPLRRIDPEDLWEGWEEEGKENGLW